MRVIDASALVKYLSREPGWRRVRELLAEGCVAPELLLKEAANSLWRRVRGGEISGGLAQQILGQARRVVDTRPQTDELLAEAFTIALKVGLTVYDALYIALARHNRVGLITADIRQAEAAQAIGVTVTFIR